MVRFLHRRFRSDVNLKPWLRVHRRKELSEDGFFIPFHQHKGRMVCEELVQTLPRKFLDCFLHYKTAEITPNKNCNEYIKKRK
jgi:hypothetical protein